MRLMHLRFLTLALALALGPAAARAQDDFDDDFGREPFDDERPPGMKSAAPVAEAEPVRSAAPEEAPSLVHNTVAGPSGGVHVVDAGSGARGSLRLAIAFDFFRRDGFLVPGARHRHGSTTLNLSVTPIEHLELAAQISAVGNENTGHRPAVIQVMGDARLYAKGYASPLPWLTVGGDFELALLNAVGGLGYQTNATSVGLRGNVTFDLRKTERPKPLIVRSSLRYYFDNSGKLVRNLERARYNALDDAAQPGLEYRHLVDNVERFAYRVNRVDSLGLSFGFEIPLAPARDFLVHPLLEWQVFLPANRQGYDCLITRAQNDRDGCLASEGFGARPSTLTVGVRTQPKLPGLGILLAVDVATSGRTSVRELAPNPPYSLWLSAGYSYELLRKPPQPIAAAPDPTPVEPVRGHIAGQVVDKHTLTPVPRAIVHIEGSALSDLASNQDGQFMSYPLEPGRHTLLISADGYETAACPATLLAEGGDAQVRCELSALPRAGSLRGRVLDPSGKPVVGARISLSGPSTLTLTSDESGAFSVNDIAVGSYEARVEASSYLVQVLDFEVRARSESAPLLTLLPKPDKPLVAVTPKKITIKQQVQFLAGSADIAPESHALLSEVADVLLRNPQITRVEVQGHTDNSGSEPQNRELSEQRAQAVRRWLVKAGVAEARLSAAGYGSSRPLSPNITPQNRARNRRVELVIMEQQ